MHNLFAVESSNSFKSLLMPASLCETTLAPDEYDTLNNMDDGDTFEGTPSPTGKVDRIAIDAAEGEPYLIKVSGDLRMFIDVDFVVLVWLNDEIDGVQFSKNASQIKLTAAFTDNCYIIVAKNYQRSGYYEVEVQAYVPSTADLFSMLDSGANILGVTGSCTKNVFLTTAGYSYFDTVDNVTYAAEAWNTYETQQFLLALEPIENFISLTFNTMNDAASADFIFVIDDNQLDAGLPWLSTRKEHLVQEKAF